VRLERRLFGRLTPSFHFRTILVVEDNDADVSLLALGLSEGEVAGELLIARDGGDAMVVADEIDSGCWPCPDLIVLDLNLPKFSGLQVLERLRASPRCGDTPVVVLSTAALLGERREATRLGANLVLQKPMTLEGLSGIAAEIRTLLLSAT
jgi:two-component system response regulator